MTSWADEYLTMLDDCEKREERLTDWERGFLKRSYVLGSAPAGRAKPRFLARSPSEQRSLYLSPHHKPRKPLSAAPYPLEQFRPGIAPQPRIDLPAQR